MSESVVNTPVERARARAREGSPALEGRARAKTRLAYLDGHHGESVEAVERVAAEAVLCRLLPHHQKVLDITTAHKGH